MTSNTISTHQLRPSCQGQDPGGVAFPGPALGSWIRGPAPATEARQVGGGGGLVSAKLRPRLRRGCERFSGNEFARASQRMCHSAAGPGPEERAGAGWGLAGERGRLRGASASPSLPGQGSEPPPSAQQAPTPCCWFRSPRSSKASLSVWWRKLLDPGLAQACGPGGPGTGRALARGLGGQRRGQAWQERRRWGRAQAPTPPRPNDPR